MLIFFKRSKSIKDIIRLRRHEIFLFNGKTVGLWTEKPYWKDGFCYQKISWEDVEYHFIFRELNLPFFFRKKKVLENLKKEFGFVNENEIRTDFENLKILRDIAEKTYISFPKEGKLPEGKKGIEFKTKSGRVIHFLLGEGKPVPKESYKSLIYPIPPILCFLS